MKSKEKKNAVETVETRKSEVRLSTGDPKEMFNKYLAENLCRKWVQDLVDEDTKEVVSIDRHEVIACKGALIDNELLAKIQFFMNAGDIQSVKVSNQKREATLQKNSYLNIWSIIAEIGGKKRRFLLYADSIEMAIEVIKDFIELNYTERFMILSIKIFNNCIILTPKYKDTEDEESEINSNVWYQISVNVCHEYDSNYTFVLSAKNVDSAMIVINDWVAKHIESNLKEGESKEDIHFTTSVVSAAIIPYYKVIEREFSAAYMEENPDIEN
jgi:hypothetical protein